MARAAPVLAYRTLDSTNAEARRLAEAGETGPLWISADTQTAGRGRRERAWTAPAGNLSATLLLTLDRSPAQAAEIAFVAALAAGDLAALYVPEALVRLKWPNDVMLDGQKLCGILIESGRTPRGQLWLAIGIGVNLVAAPSNIERPATALADHLRVGVERPPSPQEALAVLAEAFAGWQDRWQAQGFDVVRAAWSARAEGMGGPCTARLDRETVTGVAEGLDHDGALILRLSDGSTRRITAGDVFFGG